MIFEVILNAFKSVIFTIFNFINLPNLPSAIMESIVDFLDLIFDNVSCLGFFIRPTTIVVLLPLALVVINFEKIYQFTLFILKKIPFLNVR